MRETFSSLRVALTAAFLVALPSFGFWCAGALNVQPPAAYVPRVIPRQIHAGTARQHGPFWMPPEGNQRMDHHGGNLTGR